MTVVADLQALLGLNAVGYVTGMQQSAAATKQFHGEVDQAGQKGKAAAAGINETATSTAKAGQEAEAATGKLGGFKTGLANVQEAAGGLMGQLGQMVPALASIGVALGGALAVKESVSAFNDLAGAVKGFMRVTGESAEDSSKMLFAFHEVGINADTATTMVARLSKQLQGLSDGEDVVANTGKTLAESFHNLGIATVDSSGHTLAMNDIILNMADAVHTLGPGIAATDLALQAFGRSGVAMLPILLKGRDGIIELMEEGQKLGHVLSQEEVDAFTKNKMAMREFSAAIEGIKIQLGSALMPAVTAIISILVMLSVKLNEAVIPAIHSTFGFLAEFIDMINGKDAIFAALAAVIAGVLIPVIVSLTTALLANAAAFALTPVGMMAAALALLGVAVYEVKEHWDDLTERFPILGSALDAVRSLLERVGNYISDHWADAINSAINALARMVEGLSNWQSALSDAVTYLRTNSIGDIFADGMDMAQRAVRAGADAIKKEIAPIWDSLAEQFPVLQSALNMVTSGFASAAGFITDNWETAVDNVSSGINGLASIFSTVMSGIVDTVATAAHEVYELFSYLDPFAEHSPSLVSQVQQGVDEIKKAYGTTPAALDGMREAAEALLSKQIELNGLINTSKTAMDGYKQAIKEATEAYNGFKSAHVAEDKPFDDAAKELKRQQDEIRLQIDTLKLQGPLTSTSTKNALDAKGQAQRDAFGNIKTVSETSDTAIGEQVKKLQAQLDKLGIKADINSIQKTLTTGPIHEQIAAAQDTAQTLSGTDIIQGLKDSKQTIDELTAAQQTESDKLAGYQGELKTVTDQLGLYNQAISQTSQELEKLNAAAKTASDKSAADAKKAADDAKKSAIIGEGTAGAAARKTVTIDPNVAADKSGNRWDSANQGWVDPGHNNAAIKDPTALEKAMASIKQFQQSIDDLKSSVSDLGSSVWNPIAAGADTISSALSGVDWAGAWSSITKGAQSAADGVSKAWDGTIKWFTGPFMDGWNQVTSTIGHQWEKIQNDVIPAVTNLVKIILVLLAPVITGITLMAIPITAALVGLVAVFQKHWDDIVDVIGKAVALFVTTFAVPWKLLVDAISIALALLRGDWSGAWDGLGTLLHDFVYGWKDIFEKAWALVEASIHLAMEVLVTFVTTEWGLIKAAIKLVVDTLWDTVVGPALDLFKTGWDTLWNGIRTGWDEFWGGMGTVIKGAANIIIGTVNHIINAIDGIKIPAIEIPDWVPGIGGKGWDGWSPNIPTIPYLARGTRSFGGGDAMVGEEGIEAVHLPAGTQVTPARSGNSGQSGKGNVTVHIDNVNARNEQEARKASLDIVFGIMAHGVSI